MVKQSKECKCVKYQTTEQDVRKLYTTIIPVNCSNVKYLLSCKKPVSYIVSNNQEWESDVYDFGGGVALVVGSNLFGTIDVQPKYVIENYESLAKKIVKHSKTYQTRKNLLDQLLYDFLGEVLHKNNV